MALFRCVSDIIAANLNELVGRSENPDGAINLAIREMEQSISDVTSRTSEAMAFEKSLRRELDRNRSQAEAWQGRAEKAVAAGDDGLARKALARRNEHTKVMEALEDELGTASRANRTMQRQLAGLKAKLAEAKRNLTASLAQRGAIDFRKRMGAEAGKQACELDDTPFAKYERLHAKVEQVEAQAEAIADLCDMQGDTTGINTEEIQVDGFDAGAALDKTKCGLKRRRPPPVGRLHELENGVK